MRYHVPLKAFGVLGLATLLLAPSLQARPITSVKNTLTHDYTSKGGLFKSAAGGGGFGIRARLSGAVARFDVGFSDETSSTWVLSGHPF